MHVVWSVTCLPTRTAFKWRFDFKWSSTVDFRIWSTTTLLFEKNNKPSSTWKSPEAYWLALTFAVILTARWDWTFYVCFRFCCFCPSSIDELILPVLWFGSIKIIKIKLAESWHSSKNSNIMLRKVTHANLYFKHWFDQHVAWWKAGVMSYIQLGQKFDFLFVIVFKELNFISGKYMFVESRKKQNKSFLWM